MLKTSVIISFYNRIDYLEYVLAGLGRQSFRDFEIIIADDGSNNKVVEKLERISNKISYPLTHLWHEDKGFRKNKILNKAITSSNTDYLIFIDGDCVPHKEFVKEHFNYSVPGKCLTGRRVNLSEKITNDLSSEKIRNGYLEKSTFKLITDGLIGKSDNVERGFYFKSKFVRNILNRKKRGILGCNFSIHKKDMLAINGFDERYVLPSIGEDSDVQYRLELLNMEIVSLGNIAVQYHLYHKLQERPQKNLEMFAEIKKNAIYYTPFGINQ